MNEKVDSQLIVIFGASGDLTGRKLIPSLYELHKRDLLPEKLCVMGAARTEYTDEEFNEATFTFVKYYVQSRHYDELVEENQKLKYDLDQELEWRHRTDN